MGELRSARRCTADQRYNDLVVDAVSFTNRYDA